MDNYNNIEVYRRKRKQKKIIKIITIIFIVIMSLFMLYYIGGYFENGFSKSNTNNSKNATGFPINIVGENPIYIDSMGNTIVVATESKLYLYSIAGSEILSVKHEFSNPSIISNNIISILFDRGGNSFKIFSKNKLLYEKTIQNRIISAYIGSNGYFAIVQQENRYAGSVTFYDSYFNDILTWYSSDNQINSLSFKPDNSGCWVSGYNTSNGQINSTIYNIDFSKKAELSEKILEDTMILSLNNTNNNLSVVCDNEFYVFSQDGEELLRYRYNKKLSLFKNTPSHTILYFNDNNSVGKEIISFNDKGKIEGNYSPNSNIVDILYDKNKMVAISNENFIQLSYNLSLIKTSYLENGIQKSILLNNNIYHIGSSYINKIKLD